MLVRLSDNPMQVNTCPPFALHIPSSLPYYSLRHILVGKRSTVRLESVYWEQIDLLAEKNGRTWHQWVTDALTTKPKGVGATSWLRVSCLKCLSNLNNSRNEPCLKKNRRKNHPLKT